MPKIFMYRNFDGMAAPSTSAGPGLNDVSNVAGNSVRHLGDDKRKVLSDLPKDQFPRRNIFFNGFSRGHLYKFAESTDDVKQEPDTTAADKAQNDLQKTADEFKKLTHSYVQQNSWRFMPFNFGGSMFGVLGNNATETSFKLHDYRQAEAARKAQSGAIHNRETGDATQFVKRADGSVQLGNGKGTISPEQIAFWQKQKAAGQKYTPYTNTVTVG